MDDAQQLETRGNPDCVYVPAGGWWCRRCGVFAELDQDDLCGDCRGRAANVVAAITSRSRRRRRGAIST